MTPEQKQKVIDQAQQIADDGCVDIKCCNCLLRKDICRLDPSIEYLQKGPAKCMAYSFLVGIAFEKGNL